MLHISVIYSIYKYCIYYLYVVCHIDTCFMCPIIYIIYIIIAQKYVLAYMYICLHIFICI